MRRTMFAAAAIVAAACLLTGCWSKEELNDRTFAVTMMVDRTEEGQTELSLLFYLPNRLVPGISAPPSDKKPYALVSSTGRTPAEALYNIQRELPRRVTWGSLRLVVIGRKYAESGMQPLMDMLLRMPEIRPKVQLFYIGGQAKETARLATVFERFPSEVIREFAHMRIVQEVILKDMLAWQWNNEGDGFLPGIRFKSGPMLTEKMAQQKWVVGDGTVLLKGGKASVLLSDGAARGVQWIMGDVRESVVTAESPSDGKPLSLQVDQSSSRQSVVRRGDRIVVTVNVKVSGVLFESESDLDLSDMTGIRQLERAVADRIREEMDEAAQATIRSETDAFHWTDYVRYKYPSVWRSWQPNWRAAMTERMEVRTVVDFTLSSTGSGKHGYNSVRKKE